MTLSRFAGSASPIADLNRWTGGIRGLPGGAVQQTRVTEARTSCSETPPAQPPAGTESLAAQAFPWLLRQKIAIPDRVAGYLHRDALVARTMPIQRRLTVLNASGGFGKTTVLAECCRALREQAVAAAWVSLDEYDEPAVLDTYIAFACQAAGLDPIDGSDPEGTGAGPESRIGAVLRAIQSYRTPFVLAFDELEALENPASVALLQFVLQRGPPNLHLAMACRRIPDGLNVAGAVLDGCAAVIETEDLRFSRAEVAGFFDLRLSRRELSAQMDRSAGWPLALRLSRNRMERRAGTGAGVVQDLAGNWVESRLLADLAADDRDFLLDIAQFDWVYAPLLDEVLQRSDSMHRLRSMPELGGLLEPAGANAAEGRRLHPLVREHCAERRQREDPERFGAIHRRIAKALARRGDPVPAMRHAVRGSDPRLSGDILERAGGVRLWIVQGLLQLQAAERHLSEDIIAQRPRLALVRCVTMIMSGRVTEARELYRKVSAAQSNRETTATADDRQYFIDDCIVRGAIALYGGEPVGSIWTRMLYTDYERVANSQDLDPLLRGYASYGLAILHQIQADFDSAVDWLEGARDFLAKSPYITMYGELMRGQMDMVKGRIRDAESHYRRAQSIARKSFVLDPVPAASAEIMLLELAMERRANPSAAQLQRVPIALVRHGAPFSAFATACALMIEQSLQAGHIRLALKRAEELLDYTRKAGLISLARFVAAIRASVLISADRIRDAERAWRLEQLPEDAAGCVDLRGQTWREMDAIACARLRWLTATGRFEAGRELARELRRVAFERHLKRTLMRATVLSIVLEQRAGKPESAVAYLAEFLEMFAESPYAWLLLQERATCADVLSVFLERHPDAAHRGMAQSLLARIRRRDDQRGRVLSEREHKVLTLLDGRRDKQIAIELGLTAHGVRYHLRKIFNKLGVASRAEAVRRGRELGLISRDS